MSPFLTWKTLYSTWILGHVCISIPPGLDEKCKNDKKRHHTRAYCAYCASRLVALVPTSIVNSDTRVV